MKAKKILRAIGEHLGLSRAEMEHVVVCKYCDIYEQDYCLKFRKDFRGYVPREPTAEEKARGKFISDLWGGEILAQMQPILRFEDQFAASDRAREHAAKAFDHWYEGHRHNPDWDPESNDGTAIIRGVN